MKAWKLLVMFAIFLVMGCSKEDPVPPDIPQVTQVSFSIQTTFPAGVSVDNLEIFFESNKVPVKVRSISMGANQIVFTGQEAKDLFGSSARLGITFSNPTLNGSPCELLYSSEEFIYLNIKEVNNLSWSLEVNDPVPQGGVLFIIKTTFPEGVSLESLIFGVACPDPIFEAYDYITPGTIDSVYFSAEVYANFLGKLCSVGLTVFEPRLNGQPIVIVPIEQARLDITPTGDQYYFEWNYVFP